MTLIKYRKGITMKEKTYNVRVYTKWQKKNRKSKYLTDLGMTEHNTYRGNLYYEMNDLSENDLKQFKKDFWRIQKFRMSAYDGVYMKSCEMRWVRDTKYRNKLIDADYKNGRKKRCVYCGKTYDVTDMQVDHIIPVNGLMNTTKARNVASFFGIHETNDLKNLVFACKKCNMKKGAKLNAYWVIKAFIGRHKTYWKIRPVINVGIVAIVGYICYYMYNVYLAVPTF